MPEGLCRATALSSLPQLKKGSGLDLSNGRYVEITCHAASNFRPAINADVWLVADELARMVRDKVSKAAVGKFEKVSGLNFFPDGIMY